MITAAREQKTTITHGIDLTAEQRTFPIAAIGDFIPPGLIGQLRKNAIASTLKAIGIFENKFLMETIGDLDDVSVDELLAVRNFGHAGVDAIRAALFHLSECRSLEYQPAAQQKHWPALLRKFTTQQDANFVRLEIPTTMFCQLLAELGEAED